VCANVDFESMRTVFSKTAIVQSFLDLLPHITEARILNLMNSSLSKCGNKSVYDSLMGIGDFKALA